MNFPWKNGRLLYAECETWSEFQIAWSLRTVHSTFSKKYLEWGGSDDMSWENVIFHTQVIPSQQK